MFKERRVLVYVVATLTSAIAFTPALSNAKQRRDMSGYCNAEHTASVHPNAPQSRNLDGAGDGIGNASTTQFMVMVCPYRDEDFFLRQEVTALNVHVFNNGPNSVSAAACVQFFNTGTIDCGATTSIGNLGDQTLAPERSAWGAGNANHFGYVFVQLGIAGSGGLNRAKMRGIWSFSPNPYPWE